MDNNNHSDSLSSNELQHNTILRALLGGANSSDANRPGTTSSNNLNYNSTSVSDTNDSDYLGGNSPGGTNGGGFRSGISSQTEPKMTSYREEAYTNDDVTNGLMSSNVSGRQTNNGSGTVGVIGGQNGQNQNPATRSLTRAGGAKMENKQNSKNSRAGNRTAHAKKIFI